MLSPLTIFFLSLAALLLSGRSIIRQLQTVAASFGISEFSTAFVFLAVATSMPELFVAVSSSLQNAGSIVLAVALGSNVVNMTLIVGLATIISAGISTEGLRMRRDIVFGGFTTLLPVLFLLNGVLSRIEGVILLIMFGWYMRMLYKDRQNGVPFQQPRQIARGLRAAVFIALLAAVLVGSAHYTVESSVILAAAIGLPPFLIGLFLLAIGTSLPELTTTLQAALVRKPTVALGNILGSNVADSALIIGAASVIHPLTVPITVPLLVTVFFVIVSLALLGYFTFSSQRISVAEGLLLVFTFFLFLSTAFLTSVPAIERQDAGSAPLSTVFHLLIN